MTPGASDRFTRSTSLLPGFCGFAKQDIIACPTRLTRLPTGYVGEKRVIDVTGINFVFLTLFLTLHVTSTSRHCKRYDIINSF